MNNPYMQVKKEVKPEQVSNELRKIQEYLDSLNLRTKEQKQRFIKFNYTQLQSTFDNYKREIHMRVSIFINILLDNNINDMLKKILLELYFPRDIFYNLYKYTVCSIFQIDDLANDISKILAAIYSNPIIPTNDLVNEDKIKNEIIKFMDTKCEKKQFNISITSGIFLDENKYAYLSNPYNINICDNIYGQCINYFNNMHLINYIKTLPLQQYCAYFEYITFMTEIYDLGQQNCHNKVRWVSLLDGDNYHFDILSYNPIKKCERIIEVKTTLKDKESPSLTVGEYNIIKNLNKNAEYYIYFYKIVENSLEIKKLKYEINQYSNEEFFIDQDNNIYEIELDYANGKDFYNIKNNNIKQKIK